MKRLFFTFLFGFITLVSPWATAKNTDCSIARDPRRCEAKQAAQEACKELQGQARSACVSAALPPPDCRRAPNTVECQARQSTAAACKDKHGKAHRKCLKEFRR